MTAKNRKSSRTPAAAPNRDVYARVTDAIIAALEAGVVPWSRPWSHRLMNPRVINWADMPRNPLSGSKTTGANGYVYGGVNHLLLKAAMLKNGWTTPYFATFAQITAIEGGRVNAGAKGVMLMRYNPIKETPEQAEKRVKAKGGSAEQQVIGVVPQAFTVFHLETATSGVPLPVETPIVSEPDAPKFDPIAECEAVWAAYADKPKLEHANQDKAAYSPYLDTILMPLPEQFHSREHYYQTLWHEAGHSTGAAFRLNRPGIVQFDAFGSDQYAEEELIAELTAAMLAGVTGISARTIQDSQSYLQGWISKLKQDMGLFVRAVKAAEKAADYILGLSETTADETAESVTA